MESTFRFSPLEENLRKSSCEELDVAGTVESAHVAELLQFPLVLTIDSPKSADDAIEEKINKYLAVFIYSVFNELIFSKKRVDNFKKNKFTINFFCPAIFKSNQLKLTAISSADIFCKLFFSIMRADSCLYGIQLNQC